MMDGGGRPSSLALLRLTCCKYPSMEVLYIQKEKEPSLTQDLLSQIHQAVNQFSNFLASNRELLQSAFPTKLFDTSKLGRKQIRY